MARTVCYKFRLYIAGHTPNSVLARSNLGSLCRLHLPGKYKIEIVDIVKDPARALLDGIYMTPSLLKLEPSPVRMVVGTLSSTASLLEALGMVTNGA